MPKVIYCLHALSTHLFKRGQAPLIQDLYGKVDFSGKNELKLFINRKIKFGIFVFIFQLKQSLLQERNWQKMV